MSGHFEMTFVAAPSHIDVMGHVNNAVWVQWMEAIATAHWEADAPPAHRDAYAWVVTRHEIDYRGNVAEGAEVTARTFIPDPPRGARFDRCVEFSDASGKVIVASRSTWAIVDRATGRILRVPADVTAAFYP